MDELITLLVNLVKTATPIMWEAAYRQVYINVIHGSFWLLVFGAIIFVSVKSYRSCDKYLKDDCMSFKNSGWDNKDIQIGSIIFKGLAFIMALFVVIEISFLIGYLLNPKYYAIKALLDLVK